MPGQTFNNVMNGPAEDVIDITLSDSADQNPLTAFRGFMVTVAGNVAVNTIQGDNRLVPACQPGVIYDIGVTRFLATNTTATGIKGLI